MRIFRLQLLLLVLAGRLFLSGMSKRDTAGILGARWGKAAFPEPAKVYLAFCTVVPTNASTGATITEATYTGYARKEIPAASMGAPVEGSPSSIKTSAELLFAECTASSSTIIGWAVVDKAGTGEGNVIDWGTATSTAISTGSIPKVAAGALEVTLG